MYRRSQNHAPAQLPPPERNCGVCERRLELGPIGCRNPLCASSGRWFRWNVAAAERGGALEVALDAYKYAGETVWAAPFGRMLAALLTATRLLDGFDLVVASPTFVGSGGREFDHTRTILTSIAAHLSPEHGRRCDLHPTPAIIKTGPTPALAGRGHAERRCIAQERIRPVLRVPDPGRTSGRRILVVDDVFTDGRTLDEVARALRLQGGARQVCGVSLCRQPWRGA